MISKSSKRTVKKSFRFDPLDIDLIRLKFEIPADRRIQAMLDTREFIVGAIRNRVQQNFPGLSNREINLKVLEEIARARQFES